MSAAAIPITPDAFAEAIKGLPLPNLYGKASELQNSISHLYSSNVQLLPFAQDGDEDCSDAIRENEAVVTKMEERIGLLRKEVEERGARWMDAEVEDKEAREQEEQPTVNGHATTQDRVTAAPNEEYGSSNNQSSGGNLTDEQLRRRLQDLSGDAVDDTEDDSNEGVYL